MDRARPSQARRPMVPLAVVATVIAEPPRRRSVVSPGALAAALGVLLLALAVNSPLLDALGPDHKGEWNFLAVVAEGGCVMAVLGMLFRQPGFAWAGAGGYFVCSLFLANLLWIGHVPSLVLLGAVAVWQVRLNAQAPRPGQGWVPV